jgi:hypothetical protein
VNVLPGANLGHRAGYVGKRRLEGAWVFRHRLFHSRRGQGYRVKASVQTEGEVAFRPLNIAALKRAFRPGPYFPRKCKGMASSRPRTAELK